MAAPSLRASQVQQWMIASELARITAVVEAIVALCEAGGFSDRQCRLNVPVAVTEALANAIIRGNKSDPARAVRVTVILQSERLTVDVLDEGPGFDLERLVQSPDDADWYAREDGRGVFLMRELMDHVQSFCASDGSGHRLRLMLHRL